MQLVGDELEVGVLNGQTTDYVTWADTTQNAFSVITIGTANTIALDNPTTVGETGAFGEIAFTQPGNTGAFHMAGELFPQLSGSASKTIMISLGNAGAGFDPDARVTMQMPAVTPYNGRTVITLHDFDGDGTPGTCTLTGNTFHPFVWQRANGTMTLSIGGVVVVSKASNHEPSYTLDHCHITVNGGAPLRRAFELGPTTLRL